MTEKKAIIYLDFFGNEKLAVMPAQFNAVATRTSIRIRRLVLGEVTSRVIKKSNIVRDATEEDINKFRAEYDKLMAKGN